MGSHFPEVIRNGTKTAISGETASRRCLMADGVVIVGVLVFFGSCFALVRFFEQI